MLKHECNDSCPCQNRNLLQMIEEAKNHEGPLDVDLRKTAADTIINRTGVFLSRYYGDSEEEFVTAVAAELFKEIPAFKMPSTERCWVIARVAGMELRRLLMSTKFSEAGSRERIRRNLRFLRVVKEDSFVYTTTRQEEYPLSGEEEMLTRVCFQRMVKFTELISAEAMRDISCSFGNFLKLSKEIIVCDIENALKE